MKIVYSDGTPTVTYAYDKDGNKTAITDGTVTQALVYDKDERVTSAGGFAYAYDADADVTSRTYPDGTSLSYAYNPDGQVSSLTSGSAKTSYSYDAAGNLTSTAAPDGVTETRAYDPAGQLTSITDATPGATLDSYGLTLNADGQPAQVAVTQNGTAQPNRYYGYDSDGRLSSECYSASNSACSAASAGTASGSAASVPAPSGPVTSGEAGLCADDATSGTAAGNKIDIYTCNGTRAQTWTATAAGMLQVLGNCVAAAGTASGDAVELEPCSAHDAAEQWQPGASSELVNLASGLCLTDPSGTTTKATQLQVTTCSAAVYQEWRLPEDATGYVTSGVAGKCMDDMTSGTTPGTVEDIYSCNGTGAQEWTADGWSLMVKGLCLEPSGAATAAGTGLVIETCASGTTAQDWAAGPDGWVWNVAAAMCAADPSSSTTNGTQLQITACSSPLTAGQDWRIPQPLAPVGALTSGVAGKCADDATSITTAGNKIDSSACNGTGAQDWTVQGNGELQVLGNCAQIAGTASASLVELEPCSDAVTQQWAVGPGGAWIEATDTKTGQLCLADPANSTTNGTQLEITACAAAAGQEWTLASTTLPAAVTGLTVTAGAASATVSWTPPVSAGGGTVTGYLVTSSGGQQASAGPYATSATVTGLSAGTSYTFTVTTKTALGASVSAATSAITPGNQTTYAYDVAGNLTSTETDGVTTTNSYNAAEELTTSVTGGTTTGYGYNADGEQTSAGSTTSAYNAAGDLTGADTAAGNFTYGYDADGNLTSTSLNGTKVAGTTWDLNNPLPLAAEDTSAAGPTTADYTWNPSGTLSSMTTAGGTDYAVSDWLGSITGLVSTSGTQVSSTTYSAYGTPSTTGSPVPSTGYAASYTLPGAGGLDDMRARDYNPATAQFTSIDPALATTGQPYAYTSDAPTYRTDPTGRFETGLTLGVCGQAAASLAVVVGIGAGVQACFLNALKTGNWGLSGLVAGTGSGVALFASANAMGTVSNANDISDMNGLFYAVSVGGGFLGDFSGEFYWSPNGSVFGFSGGMGAGLGFGVNLWFSVTWTWTLPPIVVAATRPAPEEAINQIPWGKANSQRMLQAAAAQAWPSQASLLPCYNPTGQEAM